MSQADYQVFRAHHDQLLRLTIPNANRRKKRIGNLWGAFQTRDAKHAEADRIRAIGAAPAGNNAPTVAVTQATAVTGADPATDNAGNDAGNNADNDPGNDAGGNADNDAGGNVGDDTADSAGDDAEAAAAAATFLQGLQDQPIPPLAPVVLSNRMASVHRAPESRRVLKRRPEEDMREEAKRRKVDFLQGDIGLGPGWIAAGSPTTTSLNLVGVWVHLDENGNIDDRIVVKDSQVSSGTWNSIHFWSGDITDAARREPTESAILKRLKTHETSPYPFIELRINQAILSYRERTYRLYFTYLPFEDAQALMKNYLDHQRYFPEPWLWSVFEALARAAIAMDQGSSLRAVEGWKQIVHRDLKPGNVFFDVPDPDIYPAYPFPKVGDFGLALETSPDDPFNPSSHASPYGPCGTDGFIAPENFVWMDSETNRTVDNVKILSPCNIWGIGAIMFTLITGYSPQGPTARFQSPDLAAESAFIESYGEAPIPYGQELTNLVHWCLEYAPDDRITPQQLLTEILSLTAASEPGEEPDAVDLAQGFSRRETMPENLDGHPNAIFHSEMFWRLGLARERVDQRRVNNIEDIVNDRRRSERPPS